MNEHLNWRKDTLLWNEISPKSYSPTLNEFLEQEKNSQKRQIIAEPLANFYGLLIRKRDFIRTKQTAQKKKIRILTRMPFLPLKQYPELKKLITQRIWLLVEISRDYFYHSAMNDHSISNWKKRIDRYLERESIPLSIIRVRFHNFERPHSALRGLAPAAERYFKDEGFKRTKGVTLFEKTVMQLG